MLGKLQDSAKSGILKYFLLGLLVMAGGGLVLSDVGGFFRGGVPVDSVAKVAGKKITLQEYDRQVRPLLYQNKMTPQEALRSGLLNQYLDGLIAQALLVKVSEDNGLNVSTDSLIEDIRSFTESYQTEDRSTKDALELMLQNMRLSEKDFLTMLKSEKLVSMLTAAVEGNVIMPGILAKDYAQSAGHARKISALIVEPAKFELEAEATEDELKAYYEQAKYNYQTNERRTFDVTIVSRDALESTLSFSEDQILAYYEDNIDVYNNPATRKIEQVRIDDAGQAQEIYNIAKDTKKLKAALEQVTGASKGYLEPEDVQQSALLKELGDAVFTADTHSVLEPIETALGFQIVHVIDETAAYITPLKDIKDDVLKSLKDEELEEQFFEYSIEIEESLDSGISVAELADQFSLSINTYANIDSNGFDKKQDTPIDETLAEYKAEILEAANSLKAFETSSLIELNDGNFIAVTVTDITPAQFKPMSDIQDALKKDWVASQQFLQAQFEVSQMIDKLKSDQITFAEAAKQDNFTLDVKTRLERRGELPPYLQQRHIYEIFEAEPGETFLLQSDDKLVITRIEDLIIPDAIELDDDGITQQGQVLNRILQSVTADTFIAALQQRYSVRKNEHALDALYGTADY